MLGLLLSASGAARGLSITNNTGPYELVLLPTAGGARCLDGTPGGYYVRPGVGPNTSRWVVHMEGGGWCVDELDCLHRAGTATGSSRSWAASLPGLPGMDGGANGILSGSAAQNPDFWDWTHAHINYCDGASYAGDAAAPAVVTGKTGGNSTLYFRGRRILDAAVESMLARGLAAAESVVWNGCSAGGLATFLHADYVRAKLPPATDFVALADAGLFLDLPTWRGDAGYPAHYRYIAAMQNVSGLNAGCVAAYPAAEAWRCFMAPYTLPHISAPIFIVQALYDIWQERNIVQITNRTDAAQNASFSALADSMREVLATAPAGAGVFASSCYLHGQVDYRHYWEELTVGGMVMRSAFAEWWRTRAGVRLVDTLPLGAPGGNRCRG